MPRARVEVPTQGCLRREAFGDANADVLETDLMEKARRSLAAVTAAMAAEKSLLAFLDGIFIFLSCALRPQRAIYFDRK